MEYYYNNSRNPRGPACDITRRSEIIWVTGIYRPFGVHGADLPHGEFDLREKGGLQGLKRRRRDYLSIR